MHSDCTCTVPLKRTCACLHVKIDVLYKMCTCTLYILINSIISNRFVEATNAVNEGLHSLDIKYSYRKLEQLVWPGTAKPIHDCNQYLIKVQLHV